MTDGKGTITVTFILPREDVFLLNRLVSERQFRSRSEAIRYCLNYVLTNRENGKRHFAVSVAQTQREDLLQQIERQPGIGFVELGEKTQISQGLVGRRLRELLAMDLVAKHRWGRYSHYYIKEEVTTE